MKNKIKLLKKNIYLLIFNYKIKIKKKRKEEEKGRKVGKQFHKVEKGW